MNKAVNALYFILLGTVKVYDNTPESMNFMKKTLFEDKNSKDADYIMQLKHEENQDLTCLDDTILKEYEGDILNEKDKNNLFKTVKELQYGENFGCKSFNYFKFSISLGLNFGQKDKSSVYYYISDSACQLGVITNKVKHE